MNTLIGMIKRAYILLFVISFVVGIIYTLFAPARDIPICLINTFITIPLGFYSIYRMVRFVFYAK